MELPVTSHIPANVHPVLLACVGCCGQINLGWFSKASKNSCQFSEILSAPLHLLGIFLLYIQKFIQIMYISAPQPMPYFLQEQLTHGTSFSGYFLWKASLDHHRRGPPSSPLPWAHTQISVISCQGASFTHFSHSPSLPLTLPFPTPNHGALPCHPAVS